jgi:DNA polymerase
MIGEAPGQQEDREGCPFVGKTGKYMRKCWHAIGFPSNNVTYLLTNTVACRPPYNADPLDEQKKACMSRMQDIIRWFKPNSVITIGKHAQNYVAHWTDTLGLARARLFHIPHPRYGQTMGRRAYEKEWMSIANQL